jgi:outer membrane receptor protein involved in Fe transport
VRLTARKVFDARKLDVGADLNGRTGLDAHDITILYDLAGNVTSTTDFLSVDGARRTDVGLFIQGSTPVGARMSATAGARYDRVGTVNTGGFFGDRSSLQNAGSGFAAIAAGPFSNVTFTAQVSRGFREPTISDRFFRGPNARGFITGNPDLNPETSLQTDLGARYHRDRFQMAVYFYQYRIHNLIERFATADPDSFEFRNRGRARIRGFEAEVQTGVGPYAWLEGGAQISRGLALDDHANLDDISPDSVFGGVRVAIRHNVSTYVRIARLWTDDRPGPSEIVAPGHSNVDVGATWNPIPRLEVRGAIRNVLNETYYASPDPRFVLAPGVNGAVTIAVRY